MSNGTNEKVEVKARMKSNPTLAELKADKPKGKPTKAEKKAVAKVKAAKEPKEIKHAFLAFGSERYVVMEQIAKLTLATADAVSATLKKNKIDMPLPKVKGMFHWLKRNEFIVMNDKGQAKPAQPPTMGFRNF